MSDMVPFVHQGEVVDPWHDAVVSDHREECDNTCDIVAALRAGYPRVAAYLLQGATEADHVEQVRSQQNEDWHGFGHASASDPDWLAWLDWFHANTIQCESCEAYIFVDDKYWGDRCDNCRQVPLSTAEVSGAYGMLRVHRIPDMTSDGRYTYQWWIIDVDATPEVIAPEQGALFDLPAPQPTADTLLAAGCDIHTGVGYDRGPREALETLGSFVSAFAESRQYGSPASDNWDTFPDHLAEWAQTHDDTVWMDTHNEIEQD